MNVGKTEHPAADQLRSFGLGRLDELEMDRVAEHVATCDTCCRLLGQLSEDTLLARLKNADTDQPPEETLGPVSVRPLPSKRGAASRDLTPAALRDHPRYRVTKFIGHGGMGDVFQAEHRVMGNLVALKVIRSELLGRPKAVQRFHQEVRAAAGLNHRNIVRAFDAELAEDLHFLVMEFVEGKSLDQVVADRGPLPVQHACHYTRQVALGLAHAHERGMVHRDVKPHNLMLTGQGEVKILDFGLARVGQLAAAGDEETSLTVKGTTLGTPDYVAPEQIRDASQVDHRADLYALGCTLYFLLTASPPFPSESSVEKLQLQLTGQPRPLEEFRADVPAELAELVRRLMAKQPEHRPATAREVADRLTQFVKPTTTAGPRAAAVPQPTTRRQTPAGHQPTASPQPTMVAPQLPARQPVAVRPPAAGPLPPAAPTPAAAAALPAVATPGHPVTAGAGLAATQPDSLDTLLQAVPTEAANDPLAGGRIPLATPRSGRSALRPGVSARRRSASTVASRKLVVGGLGLLLLLVVGGAAATFGPKWLSDWSAPLAPPVAKNSRVLIVVPSQNVWADDYQPMRAVFDRAGVEVEVASTTLEAVNSLRADRSQGPLVQPDLLLRDVQMPRYRAVVMVGCDIHEFLPEGSNGPQLRRLLQQALERPSTMVASVCAAVALPARHGLLLGRRATRSEWAEQFGATADDADWTDGAVEEDGPFLTGRDDTQSGPLAKRIVARLRTSQ